jgi:ribosomal protein L16 Arg81 hydroxylase
MRPNDTIDEKLRAIQAAAAPSADEAQQGGRRLFGGSGVQWPAERQLQFNREAVELLRLLNDNAAQQNARIDALQQQIATALAAYERFDQRLQELQTRIEQSDSVTRDQHQQLLNECRERIQHVLDEQRVCVRQLSLQSSEQAVLADRARRATELRLDEFAQRVEQLAAPPA